MLVKLMELIVSVSYICGWLKVCSLCIGEVCCLLGLGSRKWVIIVIVVMVSMLISVNVVC